jgi:4-amino-4-deoxy-L-arabinose transferase-like glycosyltransferase
MNFASALNAPPQVRATPRITPLRLVVGVTLLAVAVRLVGITHRPLWLDESYSAWFSARSWTELWTVVPTYETHPPFYYSLLKLWRSVFGASAMALRFPSMLLGAATVPIVMSAARELERFRPTGRSMLFAGLAGFLAACGPTLVEHGQEARPYALMAFAYAVAMLGLLRLMRSFAANENGRFSDWMLFGVGAEITLWSHALGVLYAGCLVLALLPAWLGNEATKQRLTRGATTAVLVALFYLPCLWLIAGRAQDWSSGWLAWKPEMLLTLFAIYGVPVEVLTIVSAVAALILFLLAKRAITDGFRAKGWTGERTLLLLWWGPPILTATISALYLPLFLPRTLTPTLVPCYLAVSMALARTQQSKERTALAVALVATLFPASLAMSLRAPTERWDLVDAFLQQHVGSSDLVWLYPNDNALPLRAVGPSSTYPRRGVPAEYPATGVKGLVRAGSPAVLSLSREDAERYAARPEFRTVPTIWLVESEPLFSDPAGDVPYALAQIRRPGPERHWGYIIVRSYSLR